MKEKEFELLSKAYGQIVSDIINKNAPFYRFNRTIRWCFDIDDNLSIMGVYDREDDIVKINLNSFIKAFLEKDLKTIEYYLLHEIRHAFQHEMINDYKLGLDTPIDKSIIEKRIFEEEHYVKSLDENGNENPDYFLQDSEMDAYAFSFAVMKYKYGEVCLYVPPIYGSDFYSIVDEWINTFKEEKL